MMDPVSLATQAVALIGPYLAEGGKEAAKSAAKEVYGWLKSKLTGGAAAALGDVEKKPASELDRALLIKQLARVLDDDSALKAQLEALLPVEAKAGDTLQQLDQSGSTNAKSAQVYGDWNVTKIG